MLLSAIKKSYWMTNTPQKVIDQPLFDYRRLQTPTPPYILHVFSNVFTGVHESSLPVAHPGYQVLSDIWFRLGLIANSSHTAQYVDCSDLN